MVHLPRNQSKKCKNDCWINRRSNSMPSKWPIDFSSKIRQKRKKNEKTSRYQCFNKIISTQKRFQKQIHLLTNSWYMSLKDCFKFSRAWALVASKLFYTILFKQSWASDIKGSLIFLLGNHLENYLKGVKFFGDLKIRETLLKGSEKFSNI